MLTLMCLALALLCWHANAQPRTLVEWHFDTPGEFEGWGAPNHIADLRVEDGALQGVITDWDPFVRSPQFEIAATPWQRVDIRLKTDCGGSGEIFWTNTLDSPYGGFSPGKETLFEVIGDGQWHEYQILPFWHKEEKIILLRLDLPRPRDEARGKVSFAVDWIRVVDLGAPEAVTTEPTWDFAADGLRGWQPDQGGTVLATADGVRFISAQRGATLLSGPLRCDLTERTWVSLEMAVSAGSQGLVKWVSSDLANMHSARFPLKTDGQFHTYNLDLARYTEWRGDILLLGITPSDQPGATATIRRVMIVEEPQGGPEVDCPYLGLEDAINRVGRPLPAILTLFNSGGRPSTNLHIVELTLPDGVRQVGGPSALDIGTVEPFEPVTHRFWLEADRPARGTLRVQLGGEGAPTAPVETEIEIGPSLNLPHAEYVPEPVPVESDYEIGAFYFPGWSSSASWDPIRRVAPIRKPVLGWYDEGNPECVDWQIKWAVENGIKFFLVDWYWSAGGRSLEHWVQAFKQARHRRYLQWAIMWANHNAPGTHSEEDQRAVTRYWIDHCFNMPEYYRINDMPVVMIWSVGNMDNDMKDRGGAARLLEISREMAREAGYNGIWFIAMKWGEENTERATIQALADKGFDMTSIYHYMWHGGKAENPYHFSFDLVVESSYPHWQAWHQADVIPFLPNLSTGWDSRPWHGDSAVVIYGRTVDKFRRICQDARRFADETGIRRMVLGPLNEWGEGSYAEPCKEFGFGMYEAVRDTFCKQPPGGWPLNYGPQDVGLGPYDLPDRPKRNPAVWEFGEDAQGWGPMMGVQDFGVRDGVLRFTNISTDPAIHTAVGGLLASRYPYVVIRMSVDRADRENEMGQLFWATTTAGISEANSVLFPLIADGQMHTYVLPVHENKRWRGRLQTFRLDPGSTPGAQVAIEQIRLVRQGELP